MLKWFQKKLAQAKEQKGFSLIELMVVVAIIGILFVVLVPKLSSSQDSAKASGVKTDFRSIQVGLTQYVNDQTSKLFPASISTAPLTNYIDSTITQADADPWGSTYGYAKSSDSKYAVIWSNGPNKAAVVNNVTTAGVVQDSGNNADNVTNSDDIYTVLQIETNGNVKVFSNKFK